MEAQNTLGAFEREIGKLLKATLETRKRWAPLKHYDIGMPSAGGGQYGWWVAVGITGQSSRREEAEVECGLWWNAPPIEEPIIYAGFYKGPKRVQKLLWHRGKQGILSFERWGRTFLYVPVPESVEIE